jgi:synaptic vesicle membrane protein VAT-1
MKQVWIPKIGAPEVLEVREAADPEPGEGQVRVRTQASGVNFADIMARMGLYPDAPPLPTVVGYEVAGTVDKIGAKAEGVKVGDRVLALCRFGGYSDTIVVPAEQVIPLPDSLTFEKAAAIPVNYVTAWLMLIHHGYVQKGDRVLVHAVAGGVGVAAVQICKWRGAEIIGTASGSKHARLKELGVAHCIDYTKQDFEVEVKRITDGKGVDLVLDAVGGKSFMKSFRSLAPLGKLMMFGVSSFAPGEKRSIVAALRGLMSMPKFGAIPLMNDNRGVIGVNLGHLWDHAAKLRGMLEQIRALAADGTFDPIVDVTFPFAKAAEAHAYLQGRKNFGKVLLTP